MRKGGQFLSSQNFVPIFTPGTDLLLVAANEEKEK